jgi:hypothetical protein
LLFRLFESFAVFLLVSLFFMPFIQAQKLLRRPAAFLLFFAILLETGGLLFAPAAFADARPRAFSPPDSDWPSLSCQAGLAMTQL